jgi:hypothetical protein
MTHPTEGGHVAPRFHAVSELKELSVVDHHLPIDAVLIRLPHEACGDAELPAIVDDYW